ncbi:hypothetical protein LO772_02970 [Yinghuangia sp. ASG 101]|uniref:hypothetical protein n=1 Tax=Yinghuangia sp. ASG 101 TaxID=2896848 RepID=UPI001E5F2FE9|nr:hypothetical protein [Yinghuangia sp. ASG 101]UGQ12594.1 hypothetical protein LO772_02970 [Yinghuangia sp. ASG 101]
MTTVSQGHDSSGEVAAEEASASGAIERSTPAPERREPVEVTIRPVWFWTFAISLVLIAAVSVLAIWAGGSFSGGEPGLTAPAGK